MDEITLRKAIPEDFFVLLKGLFGLDIIQQIIGA